MLCNRYHFVASGFLAATLVIVVCNLELAAEEYVWAKFYGTNAPPSYPTDGFGSYYVPKSMVIDKQQSDTTKKPPNGKLADKKHTDSKPVEPVVDSPNSKPVASAKKPFWKRSVFPKVKSFGHKD